MRPTAALLCALLGSSLSGQTQAQPFHSSPECWAHPRVYHSPLPPDLRQRFHSITVPANSVPAGEPVAAPAGRFRFWLREVAADGSGGGGVVIDSGRPEHSALLFEGIGQVPAPQWIGNSLLYMRIPWGRMVSSDLVFDTGSAQVIYHEAAIDGNNAWQQFRAACFARCPCAEPSPAIPEKYPNSHPASDEIIGLLELPGIFNSGETSHAVPAVSPRTVNIHSAPMAQSRIMLASASPHDLEYREHGYEVAAASVYERVGDWYRVRLARSGAYGWIMQEDHGAHFLPLPELLLDRLGYLNTHWSGQLWQSPPGDNTPQGNVRPSMRHGFEELREYPATITETRMTDHGLWLKVELARDDPCARPRGDVVNADAPVLEQGWIPAYSSEGKLTNWFYPRGC